MSDSSLIEVQLTQREAALLLEYTGFLSDEEKGRLEKLSQRPGVHIFKLDSFNLSQLIGDIVYYAKEIEDERLLKELDELCIALERAEQGKHRKPFRLK